MSLFGKLFSPQRPQNVAFIEIGPDSVGGAYAQCKEGEAPLIIYTKRVAYTAHAGEAPALMLGRALSELGALMIREGAPALARITQSGSADTIAVSIAAPWQEASIRVEKFGGAKPFTFTHALITEALERSGTEVEGKVLADESVIATVLNGYEMTAPFGKEVSNASIVILSAVVDKTIAETAANAVRTLFHTSTTQMTALARVEYIGVRTLFPHEEEYLIVEKRADTTSLLLVKRSSLVGALTIPSEGGAWIAELKSALEALSKESPLPHTIFLLCEDSNREALKDALAQARLETLWVSGGAPRVIAITPELTLPLIKLAPETKPDLFLALSLLSYTHGEVFH